MHRTGPGRLRGGEHRGAVQVGRLEAHGFVGVRHERGVGVGIDVDGDGANSHVGCAAQDSARDFAAIGNQKSREAHRRNTPYPCAPSMGVLRTTERQMPRAVLVSRGSRMPSSVIAPVASRATDPFS